MACVDANEEIWLHRVMDNIMVQIAFGRIERKVACVASV
jgi:hypothetical protein